MQLNAHRVLNTSGGELRVIDGYGTIDIVNLTGFEMAIDDMSVGAAADDAHGIEGVILIEESFRAGEAAAGQRALITKMTRSGNTITVVDNKTVDANGLPTNQVTTSGNTVQYSPQSGMRYVWIDSGAEGSIKVYELNDQSSPVHRVADIEKPENLVTDTPNGRSELVSTGSYAGFSPTQTTDVYNYEFTEHPTVDDMQWVETVRKTYDSITHDLIRTRYDERLTLWIKSLTTHKHSVKGDYPINVKFLGGEGRITVKSLGSVVVGGTVAARGSTLTIDAGVNDVGQVTNTLATIESADGNSILVANRFDLNAPAGIGTNGPLYLETTQADIQAGVVASSGGDINLSAPTGDLTLSSVTPGTGKRVSITTAGGDILGDTKNNSVPHIEADTILLSSASDIGALGQFLNVDSGDTGNDTLIIDTGVHVFVRETAGDLRASIKAADVTIDVHAGSLLDSTEFELSPRDPEAIAQLVTLWTDQRLIGSGADARKNQIVDDTIALHNFEYAEYWRHRNALSDPTDPSSFRFPVQCRKDQSHVGVGLFRG